MKSMPEQAGKRISVKRLVTMALFAAILCVSAYISIPLPLPRWSRWLSISAR